MWGEMKNRKSKSNSKIEISICSTILDNHPYREMKNEIKIWVGNQISKSKFGYPPPMPNEI